MAFLNPTASVSGFSEGPAPSYKKVAMKPKSQYQKKKGFPPARKPQGNQVNTLPGTPPSYPNATLL